MVGYNGMEQLFFYHGNTVVSSGLWFLGTPFEEMEYKFIFFHSRRSRGPNLTLKDDEQSPI